KITLGPIDPAMTTVPYDQRAGFGVVQMRIQGHDRRFLVSTGVNGTVLFEGAIHDGVKSTDIDDEIWWNVGGAMRVRRVKLEDAALGPQSISDFFVLCGTAGDDPDLLAGLLNVRSLNARRVALDVRHGIFAWEPSQATELARK